MADDDNDRPEPVGSGSFQQRVSAPSRAFPNNVELVEDTQHEDLLKELLPVLREFNCLEFQETPSRRSPWVRAFCKLYHPAGPLGSNTFSNVPDMTSSSRHSFRSYKIPKIYETLQRYSLEGNHPVHKELLAALRQFFSREEYLKDCVAAARARAIRQFSNEEAPRRRGLRSGGGVRVSPEELVADIQVPVPPAAAAAAAGSPPAASRPSTVVISPPRASAINAESSAAETPPAKKAAKTNAGSNRKRAPEHSGRTRVVKVPRRHGPEYNGNQARSSPNNNNKGAWACTICTYINLKSDYLCCEMCEADRDVTTLKEGAKQQDEEQDEETSSDDSAKVPAVRDEGDQDDDDDDEDEEEDLSMAGTPQKPAVADTSKEDTSECLSKEQITDDEASSRKAESAANLTSEDEAENTEAATATPAPTSPAAAAPTTASHATPAAVAIKSQEDPTNNSVAAIQTKREKLADLLHLRQGSSGGESKMDPLSLRIQKEIDQLDTELFELILQQ